MEKRKLQVDSQNANRGTKRGRELLRKSLEEFGAGRSILIDKHGRIIAGNKTYEQAEALGLPVRVVETDGTELVAVQRTDLDLADGDKARRLAFADNRVGEVDLEWDPEAIRAAIEAGIDLGALWTPEELCVWRETVELGLVASGELAGPVLPKPGPVGWCVTVVYSSKEERDELLHTLTQEGDLIQYKGSHYAFIYRDGRE